MGRKAADLAGKRFGMLLIIDRAPDSTWDFHVQWNAICDCGIKRVVSSSHVLHKGYKSCGCLKGTGNLSHGQSRSLLYKRWGDMKTRCRPDRDKGDRYFGRGIKVCDEWLASFEAFATHVGEPPTPQHQLDRIDNDKGYEPGNVQWATSLENNRNRSSNLIIDTPEGPMCMADAADISGLTYSTLQYRVHNNWPIDRLFEGPRK